MSAASAFQKRRAKVSKAGKLADRIERSSAVCKSILHQIQAAAAHFSIRKLYSRKRR